MDARAYGERPYIIAGILGFAIYFGCSVAAMIVDPGWTFGQNCYSDLGVSNDPLAKFLFNGCCIVAAPFLIVFGIGKILFEDKLHRAGGVYVIFAAFAMVGVGLFPTSSKEMHDIFAGLFAGMAATGIVLSTVSDIMKRDLLVTISGVAIGVVAGILSWYFPPDYSELICTVCALIWLIFQCIKYAKCGALERVRPAVSPQ